MLRMHVEKIELDKMIAYGTHIEFRHESEL